MDFLKNNWFLILSVVILAWNLVAGYRKGFVRMLYQILSNLVALVLAGFASAPLGEFMKAHTSLYTFIEQHCIQFVSGMSGDSSLLSAAGVYDTAGQQAAQVVFQILMFILAFILIRIAFWIIMLIANGIAKAPVLRGINRFFGILAGGFNGILIIWILMAAFSLFQSLPTGAGVLECIQRWDFLSFLYGKDPFLFLTSIFS